LTNKKAAYYCPWVTAPEIGAKGMSKRLHLVGSHDNGLNYIDLNGLFVYVG
jgi:hypothetical protein